MDRGDAAALLSVSVVYSPRAGEVDEVQLLMRAGATVADALQRSSLQQRHAGLDLATAPIGIWGAPCRRDDHLRDRDRVEVYRLLQVDPKEARRERYRSQVKTKRG